MLVLFLTIIIFLLSLKSNAFLWLVLPISLILDFFRLKPLGYSGLTACLILLVLYLIVSSRKSGVKYNKTGRINE